MSVHTRKSLERACSVATNANGTDLHWLLDDRSTHVVILHEDDKEGWWVVNQGMRYQEGPFDTAEQAVVYCNLRYTQVGMWS